MGQDATPGQAGAVLSPAAALLEAVLPLDVEEILGLCYGFRTERGRLAVYLDVLRRKGGQKAQAAACLLCFDLARRGDAVAEADFASLLPVMQLFLPDQEGGAGPMDALLGESAYLHELWTDLQARLRGRDTRMDHASGVLAQAAAVPDAVLEVPLLDEADLEAMELDVGDLLAPDDEAMRKAWSQALDRIYPLVVAVRSFHPSIYPSVGQMEGGFRADTREDLDRLEKLREDALSLSVSVPAARAMLPLIELFLAGHTRARNLFGRRNAGRDALLRQGLAAFSQLRGAPEQAVMWLVPPKGSPNGWPKVAELLLDYVGFLGSLEPGDLGPSPTAQELAQAYLESHRPQPPPPRLLDAGERRRR